MRFKPTYTKNQLVFESDNRRQEHHRLKLSLSLSQKQINAIAGSKYPTWYYTLKLGFYPTWLKIKRLRNL